MLVLLKIFSKENDNKRRLCLSPNDLLFAGFLHKREVIFEVLYFYLNVLQMHPHLKLPAYKAVPVFLAGWASASTSLKKPGRRRRGDAT